MEFDFLHSCKRWLTVACVLVVGSLALTGCREDEQARVLNFQPGVYKGKPYTEISNKARADAKIRAYKQAGASGILGGGRSEPSRGDVRPPGQPSSLDLDALMRRAATQGG